MNALKLFCLSLLLLASCAHQQVDQQAEMAAPSFPGGSLTEALAEKKAVTDLEALFSIVFEKNDSTIMGDGALTISKTGDMSLRVYSMGFLAMELTSKDRTVKSSPRLDPDRTLILTEGLRDCLFWWNPGSDTITEDNGHYRIRGADREVWLDKDSFLPIRQTVSLPDGKELRIFYDNPARGNKVWYQSRIRIELDSYAVTLFVRDISVKNSRPDCIYCAL
ncbi:MAG: hypothetical protein ACYC69_10630 [Thermodesulfovibrionales bacterium]